MGRANRNKRQKRSKKLNPKEHLYVQKVKDDKKHKLRRYEKSEIKKQYQEQLSEVDVVETQWNIQLTSEMFYLFKGFHKMPHGMAKNNEKSASKNVLKKSGVNVFEIRKSDGESTVHDALKVIYRGVPRFNSFCDTLRINKNQWMDFLLEKGKKTNLRDCNDGKGGIALRLSVGFTNNFPTNKVVKYVNVKDKSVKLPYLHVESIRKIPKELREQVGRIFDFGKGEVLKHYPDAFNNKTRARMFGQRFCKMFDKNCRADFEYLEIFLSTGSTLKRHMDYQNGNVDAYSHGASYSLVFNYNGENKDFKGIQCRSNFIITARKVCDEKIKFISDI